MLRRAFAPAAWAAAVLASAPFALPVYLWLLRNLGARGTFLVCLGFVIAAIVPMLFTARHWSRERLFLFALSAVSGIVVAFTPLFETAGERIHMFLFAIQAHLVCRARRRLGRVVSTALLAIVLCALLAIADEWLQSLTPGRYGQAKDVLLATLGSIWGVSLHASSLAGPRRAAPTG